MNCPLYRPLPGRHDRAQFSVDTAPPPVILGNAGEIGHDPERLQEDRHKPDAQALRQARSDGRHVPPAGATPIDAFADITVFVGMHTFKVHRSVVSYLSPICYKLFARASSNPSSCLKIHQTSPAAWSVLLDFAYGIDVEERLGKDLELAMDVASVAGHFQAQQLRGIALKFADVTLSTLGGVIHKLQGGTEVNWAIS